MPLNELIQKLIHTLETGRGTRYLWFIALGLAIVGLAFLYDGRAYRNLATQEAMDSAQLARNLSLIHIYNARNGCFRSKKVF